MGAEQDGVGQDGPRAGTPGAERDRVAWDYFPHDHARSRAYRGRQAQR